MKKYYSLFLFFGWLGAAGGLSAHGRSLSPESACPAVQGTAGDHDLTLSSGACSAREVRRAGTVPYDSSLVIVHDSVFHYASLVNDYFMRVCPDPTVDSYVGGKKRNSRIWTRGVYYEGLMAMYRQHPVERWYDYTVEWGDFHQWVSNDTKAPTNADYHCCGMAYLDMYTLDPTQTIRKEHIRQHIDKLMWERKSIDDWYWIDAVHMAMPIYAQLGVIEDDDRYFEYMYNMYMFTRNKQGDAGRSSTGKGKGSPLFNESDGLWYRDYAYDPPYTDLVETDKPCYWSRGNGWVYTALARVLDYAPDTLCHREQYVADFVRMSEALAACQRADGFWSVSLAAPTNFGSPAAAGPETSGTSLFVAGMAYGVHAGLLDSALYLPHIVRGWNALCHTAIGADGFLGYVQGTGAKPEDSQPVVFSTVPNFGDFGVGCFLLAAAEVYKLGDIDLNEEEEQEEPQGISGLHGDTEPVRVEYYSAEGFRLDRPAGGLYIERCFYPDGAVRIRKVLPSGR